MSRTVSRADNAWSMVRRLIETKRSQAAKLISEADELEKIAGPNDPRQTEIPGSGKK